MEDGTVRTAAIALALLIISGSLGFAGEAARPGDAVDERSGRGSAGAAGHDTGRTVEPGTLGYYLELGREVSPSLDSARARSAAKRERARYAGGLPEPVLTYGHYFESVETRVGPQTRRLGVRQTVPLFGKLGLARRAAEARADAEAERARATGLDVDLAVTRAYAEYHYLSVAADVVAERLILLAGLEAVVRESYSAGGASYSDLMSAQIAVASAEDRLASLREQRGAASASLSAAVGIGIDNDLPLSGSLPVRAVPSNEEARSMFDEGNPDLKALDLEVEAAGRERSRAARGFLPDVTLGVDYIETGETGLPVSDSGKDPVIGVATVNLPIWFGQTRARVREAASVEAAVDGRRRQAGNELRARLEGTLADLRDLERRVELHRYRLLPAAEQAVAATEASYSAGEAGLDALVKAHETALEFELALQRAGADLIVRAAELDRQTGARWMHTDGIAHGGASGDDQ
jgi:cobalt-zinc-cadmium efflux system outer membrane protein